MSYDQIRAGVKRNKQDKQAVTSFLELFTSFYSFLDHNSRAMKRAKLKGND